MQKRKIFTLVLLLVFTFAFTGCSKRDLKDILETADAFFQAADAPDIETVANYCTENVITELGWAALTPLYNTNTFFLGTGFDKATFSKESLDAADDFGLYLSDVLVQNYTITDVSKKGGIGYVKATITTFPASAMNNLFDENFHQHLETIMASYTTENMDELSQIYIKEGEDALTHYILDKTLPEIMDYMKDVVNDFPTGEVSITLQLDKIDGKWIITNATKDE